LTTMRKGLWKHYREGNIEQLIDNKERGVRKKAINGRIGSR